MTLRIGVDIGGTFTDLALGDDTDGTVFTHKLLTTPEDPSKAVVDGVEEILHHAKHRIEDVRTIVHGTTLVTNAVIERRGCRVGMLVTKGFKDTLDIGRETRYDLYDLRLAFAQPLIDRSARLEVAERVDSEGRVRLAIDEESVSRAMDQFVRRERIEAVAICLLHSYANPRHEVLLAELVRRRFPHLHLSLSSEGYPVIREYTRWTTTALNAYVQPVVDRYLARIESGLGALGFSGRLFIMASNGGALTPAVARRFPSRLLESGPAAGILMSAHVGRKMSLPNLLTFDMGGTTAKGALVVGGRPLKAYELEVARVHHFRAGSGLTVNLPVIDMIEIGAGGGSLAGINGRRLLQVGPASAGAVPGPACYQRGGTRASLTDANLVLGYLDPRFFLGGRMKIDAAAAREAVDTDVGSPLSLTTARAAWGVHEVVNENVANAFRVHAAERGLDVRRCAMLAFGGSGPLHAMRIARKLRIDTVVLPPAAGVMSALGLLVSPLSFEVAHTRPISLADLDIGLWEAQFTELRQRAMSMLAEAKLAPEEVELRGRLDLRYIGQGFEVGVDIELGAGTQACIAALPGLFTAAYTAVFGMSLPEQPSEIVTWRLAAVARARVTPEHSLAAYHVNGAALKGLREAYDPESGSFVAHSVYDRYRLPPGKTVAGPALIEELECTTVLGAGMHATVDQAFNITVQASS